MTPLITSTLAALTIATSPTSVHDVTATSCLSPATSALVVTPFPVPVGIPVAPLAPTFYSYQQLAPPEAARALPSEVLIEQLADAIAARLHGNAQALGQPPTPPDAAAIVKQHCVRCHGGETPKGQLNLDRPVDTWDRALRQESLLRMLSTDPQRRMPKDGPPLSEAEFLLLFRELVK